MVVVPRVPTPLEELQAAETLLIDYISNIAYEQFTDNITLPDFSANGVVVPNINWTGSPLINTDGSTNRPRLTDLPLNDPPYQQYQKITSPAKAKLIHPLHPSVFIEVTFPNLKIKRLPGTAEEIANAALVAAKQAFYNYYTPTASMRREVEDTLPYLSVPAGVRLRWQNGD